jgi:putative salt-induced outer membrane protein YdiY
VIFSECTANGKPYIQPLKPVQSDDQGNEKVPWPGEVSIGYQNQSGNVHQHRINYFAKVDRTTKRTGIHFEVSGRNGSDSSNIRNEAGNLRARYCIKHENRTWQFAEIKLDYNRPLDIDQHRNVSIGTGWDLQKTQEEYLLLSAGIGADKLDRINNADTDFTTGAVIVDFKQSLVQDNYIEGNVNFYPRLNDFSNLKADSRISMVHPLTKKASLKLTLQQNYFSEIGQGASKFDRNLYASLSRKF